jgi:rare lipoprotein A
VPKYEPPHRFANRPYQVFGRDYVPLRAGAPFKQQGTASWYGKRFHGASTSSGERYDMYGMTAAHPVLPIPSYARVTNLANGKSVVVRINDRGPFHAGRVIDLSYTAAYRLGYVEAGSALVEVEAIVPGSEAVAVAPQPKPAPVQAPAAIAAARPGAVEPAERPGGVFLQLGAFGARENAESLRARMAQELSWLSEVIEVFASGGLFRLQLGPYRSQDEARRVAERIFGELNVKPLVVVR